MLKNRPINHDVLLLLHFTELKPYFVQYAEENIIEFCRHLKMTLVEDSSCVTDDKARVWVDIN